MGRFEDEARVLYLGLMEPENEYTAEQIYKYCSIRIGG